MTHPLNMPHVAGVRCSDLPTTGEWLRALAGNLALIRTWWAVPMVVAHLLIHIADIVAFWRHGQASVLYPVLCGGQDHSARAVLTDRNPMVCRGEFTTGAACSTRRHRPPMAPKVVVQWSAPRRRVMTSVRISTSGYVACFDPKVTA